MSSPTTYTLLVTLITIAALPVFSKELPLWEAGGGVALLANPHYLGADQESIYLIPLPYFIYRGEKVKADRKGIRGLLYRSDRFNLNISSSGSLPVSSKDNNTREGMDDLDLMVEIGPTLQYTFYKTDKQLLRMDIPVRAAFTLGGKFFNHQGWTVNPRLYYSATIEHWTVTSTLGPLYGDHRYHGYFYNVDQPDVTTRRGFYQANSGLTGRRFSLGLNWRYGDLTIGSYMQYYNLHDAENAHSPLMKQDDYFSMGLYVAWIFGRSEVLVKK